MPSERSVSDAIEAINLFLKARACDGQCDQELIYGYYNERVAEGRISLLRSDLELVLEAAWTYEDLRNS